MNAMLKEVMNPYLSILAEHRDVKRKGTVEGSGAADDDAAVFARFLEGDNAAFIELFDRHTPRLGRYCRKMIGDPHRVEDIMQDLWEKVALLRGDGKSPPHNPLGLLYWMARNLCLNHIRDRRQHLSLDSLSEMQHPSTMPGELSHMEELVMIAMERLPLDQREVLILYAYSGYKFEEIAQMVGESHGAVRTRAWRARRQLKRIIAALIELDENRLQDEQSNTEDHE